MCLHSSSDEADLKSLCSSNSIFRESVDIIGRTPSSCGAGGEGDDRGEWWPGSSICEYSTKLGITKINPEIPKKLKYGKHFTKKHGATLGKELGHSRLNE
jgi:hypothetical protein